MTFKLLKYLKNFMKRIMGELPTESLVKRGLRVGKGFSRQQGCFIDPSHAWLISIGDNVTFSLRVTVLAHDASTKLVTGYTKIGRVNIGNNVFVGANTTILPGVNIGNNVIIGAGSVVTKSVPDNSVAAGNPARVIRTLNEFAKKEKTIFDTADKFSFDYNYARHPSKEMMNEQIEKLSGKVGYIE